MRQRPGDIPGGLQIPDLSNRLVHELLAAAIVNQDAHALGGGLAGLEFQRLIHQRAGGAPIGVRQLAGALHQLGGELGTNGGVAGIQIAGPFQSADTLLELSLLKEPAAFGRYPLRVAFALHALGGLFLESQQLGIIRKFLQTTLYRFQGLVELSGLQMAVDLFHPVRLGFAAHLLIAALLEALHLEIQARIFSVDGFENFPLAERLGKLALFFVKAGFGHDLVHQRETVADQLQRALEVRLAGKLHQRFFQYVFLAL